LVYSCIKIICIFQREKGDFKNTNDNLKKENESLHQEIARLQQVLQEVTAVNKRWQRYNNDRRLYVQKLLATIQELQEQMNGQGEAAIHDNATAKGEKMCRQHNEQIQLLNLQIKAYTDDWQSERR